MDMHSLRGSRLIPHTVRMVGYTRRNQSPRWCRRIRRHRTTLTPRGLVPQPPTSTRLHSPNPVMPTTLNGLHPTHAPSPHSHNFCTSISGRDGPMEQQGSKHEVEEINTKELAQKISSELKRYSIPQAVFAQRVLCRSQGTLSDLLRNPKPWSKLKSGRETFRRMWKWLQEPEFQRMSALRLAGRYNMVHTCGIIAFECQDARPMFFFSSLKSRGIWPFEVSFVGPSIVGLTGLLTAYSKVANPMPCGSIGSHSRGLFYWLSCTLCVNDLARLGADLHSSSAMVPGKTDGLQLHTWLCGILFVFFCTLSRKMCCFLFSLFCFLFCQAEPWGCHALFAQSNSSPGTHFCRCVARSNCSVSSTWHASLQVVVFCPPQWHRHHNFFFSTTCRINWWQVRAYTCPADTRYFLCAPQHSICSD